jgi:hypothetical protein
MISPRNLLSSIFSASGNLGFPWTLNDESESEITRRFEMNNERDPSLGATSETAGRQSARTPWRRTCCGHEDLEIACHRTYWVIPAAADLLAPVEFPSGLAVSVAGEFALPV